MNKLKEDINFGYLLAVLSVIIWSGSFVAARFLTHLSPIETSFYRWFITFIVLTPFCIKSTIKNIKAINGIWLKVIIISILGITIFNTFVYLAAYTTSATNISLLITLSPIVIALINRIFWKVKITNPQKIGIALAAVGIIIIITKGSIDTIINLKFAIGDFYMLIGVILFAAYSSSVKIRPKEFPEIAFLYLMVTIGVIPLIILMIFKYYFGSIVHIDTKTLLILIYVGVFPSALGYVLWNMAINRIGAVKSGIIYNSIPVFSSIEAMIFLNEKLLLSQVIGGILIIIAIVYSLLNKSDK